MTHEAATPPRLVVPVRVELKKVKGRRLTFEVEASDGVDVIGRGSHGRFVIDAARLDTALFKTIDPVDSDRRK